MPNFKRAGERIEAENSTVGNRELVMGKDEPEQERAKGKASQKGFVVSFHVSISA
jgi:hypothetical protein